MNKYFKIRNLLFWKIKGSWILNVILKSEESKLYNKWAYSFRQNTYE